MNAKKTLKVLTIASVSAFCVQALSNYNADSNVVNEQVKKEVQSNEVGQEETLDKLAEKSEAIEDTVAQKAEAVKDDVAQKAEAVEDALAQKTEVVQNAAEEKKELLKDSVADKAEAVVEKVKSLVKSEKVKKAQEALKAEGYSISAVDGILGKETKNALKKYQTSKGLEQSGLLNEQTIVAMNLSEEKATDLEQEKVEETTIQ